MLAAVQKLDLARPYDAWNLEDRGLLLKEFFVSFCELRGVELMIKSSSSWPRVLTASIEYNERNVVM